MLHKEKNINEGKLLEELLNKLQILSEKKKVLNDKREKIEILNKLLKEKRDLIKDNIYVSIIIIAIYLGLFLLASSISSAVLTLSILFLLEFLSLSVVQTIYFIENNNINQKIKKYTQSLKKAKRLTSKEEMNKLTKDYINLEEEILKISYIISSNKTNNTYTKKINASTNPTLDINKKNILRKRNNNG